MGNANGKHKPLNRSTSSGNNKPQSFHSQLVLERHHKHHDFDEIYEVVEPIGMGGLCKIYKIRKIQVGGSSRPEHQRQRSWTGRPVPRRAGRKRSMSGNSSRRPDDKTSLVRHTSAQFDYPVSESLEDLGDTFWSVPTHPSTPLPALPSPPTRASTTSLLSSSSSSLTVSTTRRNGEKPLYFALKVINLTMVKEDRIDSLRQEVEILKSLDHPNIIKAYETFQMKSSRKLMIVMELCTGGDLHARLPYTEAQAAAIAKQVLSALGYLHANRVVHRDLKFENIMFESESQQAVAKIIDFGLSKAYDPHENDPLTQRVGTLCTMSPETMQGSYSYPADLWSMGVVCYMMLNGGRNPFAGETPKHVVVKVLQGKFDFEDELWETVSDTAKTFIRNLLVVAPAARASAVQALSHPWVQGRAKNANDNTVDAEFVQRVRESIVKYADTGEFRKLALNVIAKKSSSEEIFRLRQVFDEFDTLNTGTLTMPQFRAALSQFNYSEQDIRNIFRKVDVNHSNVINYTEFLAAALETQGNIEEYRLAEAFDLMDADDSGYISRSNLRQILGQHSDEDYIDRLIAEADSKKDGRISYEEFLQVFAKEQRQRVSGIYHTRESLLDDSTEALLRKYGIRGRFIIRDSAKILSEST